MLSDKEAEEIRVGLAAGMRGPVLIKWDIMRTLERSKDALAEGRIDEFEACARRLESAARLLEQLPLSH